MPTATEVLNSEITDQVASQGFAISRSRLDPGEVHSARSLISTHFKAGKGVTMEGAVVQPAAAHLVPGLAWLYAHPQIIDLAQSALGTSNIVFTGHSDAHQGFTLGWHKDSGSKATGNELSGYFNESPETLFQSDPEVVKIGIYLQDSTSHNCLRVDPGSHLRPSILAVSSKEVIMQAGDLVVFDVRITHAGAKQPEPDSPVMKILRDRVSAFVSFGKPGRRTEEFSRTNMERQRRQLDLPEGEPVPTDAGHAALLASRGVTMWNGA